MGTNDRAVKASLYIMLSVVIAMFLSLSYYFSEWSKCQHGLKLLIYIYHIFI